jgi:acyl-coenzyme A thioesterase PaaI-like protein
MDESSLDGSNCFVCGKTNPLGLRLTFRLEDEVCRSEFTPAADHCGFNDITHGGIIFSALDDVMANWIYLKGMRAYTAKCDIRYKGSLPTGTAVALEGHCIKHRGRLIIMRGKMTRQDTGELVAETEASFMLESKSAG